MFNATKSIRYLECTFDNETTYIERSMPYTNLEFKLKSCLSTQSNIGREDKSHNYLEIPIINQNDKTSCIKAESLYLPIKKSNILTASYIKKGLEIEQDQINSSIGFNKTPNSHYRCEYFFKVSKQNVINIIGKGQIYFSYTTSNLNNTIDHINEALIVTDKIVAIQNVGDKGKKNLKQGKGTKMYILWIVFGCVIVFLLVLAFVFERL